MDGGLEESLQCLGSPHLDALDFLQHGNYCFMNESISKSCTVCVFVLFCCYRSKTRFHVCGWVLVANAKLDDFLREKRHEMVLFLL